MEIGSRAEGPMSDPDFRYISLGAGVQSSALLLLAQDGRFGKVDVAIFADTQDEPGWVYDLLSALKTLSTIPIVTVSKGRLSDEVVAKGRFPDIPAFTEGGDGRAAPLRRQCTFQYKLKPIEREVRRAMGFKKGQRIKGVATAEALIGISIDEATRMRDSRTAWVVNRYPLVDLGMSRESCERVVRAAGLSPKKSSCVFCPYHDDRFWTDLKDNHPEEFRKAVDFDEAIRDMSMSGVRRPVFLHRSLVPLKDVKFRPKRKQANLGFFQEECEGMCGV